MVDADLSGAQPQLPRLPAELSRQAYRMVQEAVTNAVRHGDGSTVRVRLDVTAEGMLIDVNNPLPAPRADAADAADQGAAEPTAGPGGRGLIGLRRRVSALGGSVTAGPVAPQSWRLLVQLPLETALVPTESRRRQG
jgi:signal transduction histidine kinase